MMKPKDVTLLVGMALGIATVSWAARMATQEEVLALQSDLRNLEAELGDIESDGETISAEIGRRVASVREDAIYLKVKMERHREVGESGSGVEIEEVEELRRDIDNLRSDIDRLHADRVFGTVSVPEGTTFQARLVDTLSTESAKVGDRFRATTFEPMSDAGHVVVPAGATVEGRVELVERPGSRTDRSSRLVLGFDSIVIEGTRYPLEATVTDASEDMKTGIGDEAAKIGVGAGIGAILGAVLGGEKGAVIGGVIGGAGAILGTEGKDVVLPRNTMLELRLDERLSLRSSDASME